MVALAPLKQTWIDKGLRQTGRLHIRCQKHHWNRPELIRDYDRVEFALRCYFHVRHWNRPELIRDYDMKIWLFELSWNFLLKQTWIDKGLRLERIYSILKFFNLLKQTWIDKGLRPGTFSAPSTCIIHWNRPELIRDYDLAWVGISKDSGNDWNRPELIGDYDLLNDAWLDRYDCALKQTWIDKGLRHVQQLIPLLRCQLVLKQTWIDKGLRPSSLKNFEVVAVFET